MFIFSLFDSVNTPVVLETCDPRCPSQHEAESLPRVTTTTLVIPTRSQAFTCSSDISEKEVFFFFLIDINDQGTLKLEIVYLRVSFIYKNRKNRLIIFLIPKLEKIILEQFIRNVATELEL